jgi:elongation factor 1 alpha-like protein
MEDGLEKIREILGTEEQTGLSDQTINQTLWDAWFDVDKALGWLLRTSKIFKAVKHQVCNLIQRGTRKTSRSSGA